MVRWAIFVVVICLVGLVVFAELHPESLRRYPALAEINDKVRELLGMGLDAKDDLFNGNPEAGREILRAEERATEAEQYCGQPPENPLTGREAPTSQAYDLFVREYTAWQQCVRKVGESSGERPRVAGAVHSPKLDDFREHDAPTVSR